MKVYVVFESYYDLDLNDWDPPCICGVYDSEDKAIEALTKGLGSNYTYDEIGDLFRHKENGYITERYIEEWKVN